MFYNKHRPQTVADLDNQHIRETLGKTLLENKWAQAYLLTGPRGTGKTTTARLIAKIVNCQSRKLGEEPCNKCDACLAVTNGSAMDVIEIDAASNRGIDEMRDLREKIKLTPSAFKYKVYIIDEVHMLTTEAFNALLKTLEEPPAHVIFVLATTDLSKLPATITSRCQHFEFGQSSIDETVRSLKRVVKEEKIKIEEKVLEALARAADGSFRDAHKILEQLTHLYPSGITIGDWEKFKPEVSGRQIKDLVQHLLAGDKKTVFSQIENYVRSGRKIRDLQVSLINSLREVLLNQLHGQTKDGSFQIKTEQLVTLLEDLIKSSDLARFSPVPQLPLELVVARWSVVMPAPASIIPKDTLGIKKDLDVPTVSDNLEPAEDEIAKWAEILLALKAHNHSLVAFLRAAKPAGKDKDILVIEVFYKFHKDKLEEKKNRDTIEKVVSDIMGKETKIKFTLGDKNKVSKPVTQ